MVEEFSRTFYYLLSGLYEKSALKELVFVLNIPLFVFYECSYCCENTLLFSLAMKDFDDLRYDSSGVQGQKVQTPI